MSSSTTNNNAKKQEARILPKCFAPGDNQVIIGRGKRCLTHEGNKRLRNIVKAELKTYVNAGNKIEKSVILLRVIRQVRQNNKDNVGFVKQDLSTGRWYELTEFASRVSVAQAFRDANSSRYKSSKQSKQYRRKVERLNSMVQHSPDRITVSSAISQPFLPNGSQAGQTTGPLAMVRTSLNIPPRPMNQVISSACDLIQQCGPAMGAISMAIPNYCHPQQMGRSMMPSACMIPEQMTIVPQTQMRSGYMVAEGPAMGLEVIPSRPDPLEPLHVGEGNTESNAGPFKSTFEDATEENDDFLEVFHSTTLPNLKAALSA